MEIYLKKEFQQFTGSFKERGARNFLLNLTPGNIECKLSYACPETPKFHPKNVK